MAGVSEGGGPNEDGGGAEYASCACGRSWCRAPGGVMDDPTKVFLLTPEHLSVKTSAISWRSEEEFYRGTYVCVAYPVMPPHEAMLERLQLVKDPEWETQFAEHFAHAKKMEHLERWPSAVLPYKKCKDMIMQRELQDDTLPRSGVYLWLSMLVGTRLASLLQVGLGGLEHLEECAAILEWLLGLFEPPTVSSLLMMHHAAVLYQWSCGVRETESDAAKAEGLLQRAMKVKHVIGVAVQPGPDLKVFFCLSLAAILPHQAKTWLTRATEHVGEQQLHLSWNISLRLDAVMLYYETGAWEECLQAGLKLRLTLDEHRGEIPQELYEVRMSDLMTVSADCLDRVSKKQQERGIWWTKDEASTSAQRLDLRQVLGEVHLDTMLRAFEQRVEANPEVCFQTLGDIQQLYYLYHLKYRDYHKEPAEKRTEVERAVRFEEMRILLKKQASVAKKIIEWPRSGSSPSFVLLWQCNLVRCYIQAAILAADSLQAHQGSHDLQRWLTNYEEAKSNYEASFNLFSQITGYGTLSASSSIFGDVILLSRQVYGSQALCGLVELQCYQIFRLFGQLRGQERAGTYTDGSKSAPVNLESHVTAILGAFRKVKEFWAHWTLSGSICLSEDEFLHFIDTREGKVFQGNSLKDTSSSLHLFLMKKTALRIILHACWQQMALLVNFSVRNIEVVAKDVECHFRYCDIELVASIERRLSAYFAFRSTRSDMANNTKFTWEDWQSKDAIIWNVICDCQIFCSTPLSEPSSAAVAVLYDFDLFPPSSEISSSTSKGVLHIFVICKGGQHERSTIREGHSFDVDIEKIDDMLQDVRSQAPIVYQTGVVDKYLEYMHECLVKPISHILAEMRPEDKLIFMGGKYFTGVPFPILKDARTNKYLFQQHTISVTSSFLALWHCHQRFVDLQSHPIGEAALAVADPAYGKAKDRLPGSGEEIASIQDIFKEDNITVAKMEGTEANIQSFLDEVERPGRRAFVHLAVHAGIVQKNLSTRMGQSLGKSKQGAIFLANPKVKTWPPLDQNLARKRNVEDLGSQDESELNEEEETQLIEGDETEVMEALVPEMVRSGMQARITLAADDILQRGKTWNADMVFLSACESACGQTLGTGGLLNLPQALMLTGVPCIIASQWVVPDGASTQQLIKHFYQGAKDGLDVSCALRHAMENMLVQEPHNILQWGAFSVWGLPTVHLGTTIPLEPKHFPRKGYRTESVPTGVAIPLWGFPLASRLQLWAMPPEDRQSALVAMLTSVSLLHGY